MNANELADVIDKLADAAELQTSKSHADWHRNVATMLRQQQAEIEALKKQLAFMEGEYPEPTIMAKMMEVDLVRQQQAEIEALKSELHKYKPQIWEIMRK